MVQGPSVSSMTSSHLESYKCSALENIHLQFVDDNASSGDQLKCNESCFQPLFAHQIFGEDELIFGYKDLTVHLYYTKGSLKCFADVKYSEKLDEDVAQLKVDPDPLTSLKPNFENDLFTSRTKFEKELTTDISFCPFGNQLKQYTVTIDSIERVFCVFKCGPETSGFLNYHKDVQTFLTWFIDGASFIDDKDPNWMFYLTYEKTSLNGNDRYSFVGYATVYLFYAHPHMKRARLSQFLVLPPFGRKGHGSQLLTTIYDDLRVDSLIKDITVEDPSEDFVMLRDVVDCKYLIDYFSTHLFTTINNNDNDSSTHKGRQRNINKHSKQLAVACQNNLKINQKQFRRLYEMLLYMYLDTKNKRVLVAYKNALKQKIRKSLEQPKTKLSAFIPEAESAQQEDMDVDAANGGAGLGTTLVHQELLDNQANEIFSRTMQHYLNVVNKVQSLV